MSTNDETFYKVKKTELIPERLLRHSMEADREA